MKDVTPGGVAYGDSTRPEIVSLVPTSAEAVLDVGCATGAFGEALKRARRGVIVDGIEPNDVSAAHAKQRLDSVHVGTLETFRAERSYDCVCFIDVLEHLVDPWSTVRDAAALLRPGGVVVASIPNVRHIDVALDLLIRGRFRYAEYGILDKTHLRFFTRESAVSLFAEMGYSVETVVAIEVPSARKPYRLMRRFGKYAEDLRAVQYGVVARRGSP